MEVVSADPAAKSGFVSIIYVYFCCPESKLQILFHLPGTLTDNVIHSRWQDFGGDRSHVYEKATDGHRKRQ